MLEFLNITVKGDTPEEALQPWYVRAADRPCGGGQLLADEWEHAQGRRPPKDTNNRWTGDRHQEMIPSHFSTTTDTPSGAAGGVEIQVETNASKCRHSRELVPQPNALHKCALVRPQSPTSPKDMDLGLSVSAGTTRMRATASLGRAGCFVFRSRDDAQARQGWRARLPAVRGGL